jgi:glutamate racemase
MKIGFFDSGLGGLFVMKATVALLPTYDYEFYGDTLHVPYGERSEEEIYNLTKIGVTALFEKGCSLVIIACNTASAATVRKLQDTFLPSEYPTRKILGVIIPMVEEVVAAGSTHALLLATKRTVESGKYEKECAKFVHAPSLISIATPSLVPLIEAGALNEAVDEACRIIKAYVNELVDAVILGCTHYGLLKEGIEAMYPDLKVYSQADIIPHKLKSYLEAHSEIKNTLSTNGTRNLFLSKNSAEYDQLLGDILGGQFIQES